MIVINDSKKQTISKAFAVDIKFRSCLDQVQITANSNSSLPLFVWAPVDKGRAARVAVYATAVSRTASWTICRPFLSGDLKRRVKLIKY